MTSSSINKFSCPSCGNKYSPDLNSKVDIYRDGGTLVCPDCEIAWHYCSTHKNRLNYGGIEINKCTCKKEKSWELRDYLQQNKYHGNIMEDWCNTAANEIASRIDQEIINDIVGGNYATGTQIST